MLLCAPVVTASQSVLLPPYRHRTRHGVDAQIVVLHLRHLLPREPSRVRDRCLEDRRSPAVGDDVQPVAVGPVLGDSALVGRQQDRARGGGESLDLDQANVSGHRVETRDVVADVVRADVLDTSAKFALVVHDHAHGRCFGPRVGLMAPHLGGGAIRVWQHEYAGDPFDALEGQRPLLLQFFAPPFAAGEQLGVPRLRHRKPALGALCASFHVCGDPSDLVVGALKKLCQRELQVSRHAIGFREALSARVVEERREDVLLESVSVAESCYHACFGNGNGLADASAHETGPASAPVPVRPQEAFLGRRNLFQNEGYNEGNDRHPGRTDAERQAHRDYLVARRARWTAAGLCTECGGDRDRDDRKQCARCRRSAADKQGRCRRRRRETVPFHVEPECSTRGARPP